ncbi:hypothetical protein AAG570_010084 [Ranatra chinensis]|uniref:Uncharacterized protein n=1 Tax=Ranatra chinensis TaxID=642074 RepID=A0ABD0YZQ7_9HEMI
MFGFDFDKLCHQAREFEKLMIYVRKKIIEPSKFGQGDKVARTLGDVKEEVASLEASCVKSFHTEKQISEQIDEKNKIVTSEIDAMWTDLGLVESSWKKHNYKSCPLTDHLVDDTSSILESDSSEKEMEFQNGDLDINELPLPNLPLATSSAEKEESGSRSPITPFGIRRRFESSRMQFSTPDHIPEMSNLTMEILGRSAKVNRSRRRLY